MKENTYWLCIWPLVQVICVNLLLSEFIGSILEKYMSIYFSLSHASSMPMVLHYSKSPKSSNTWRSPHRVQWSYPQTLHAQARCWFSFSCRNFWWSRCTLLQLQIMSSNKPVLVFSTKQIAIINSHYQRFWGFKCVKLSTDWVLASC